MPHKSLSYEVVPMTSKETYPCVWASVMVVLVAWLAMYSSPLKDFFLSSRLKAICCL